MAYPVELYIYDLTRGMANSIAPMLGINFDIEGVWHTAIIVHGREWFFGAMGVESCHPGTTMLGQPLKRESLGRTSIDPQTFNDYITTLSRDTFAGHKYDLFKHNCNNFSNTVSTFLCGRQIPQYILDLPDRFLSTPIAQMLRPWIEQMTPQNVGGGQSHESTGQSSAFRDETSSSRPPPPAQPSGAQYSHFPVKDYVMFNSDIDMGKLRGKLEEFNSSAAERGVQGNPLAKEEIECVMNVRDITSPWWKHSRKVLESWSGSETFPVLDLIRWRLSAENGSGIPDEVATELYNLLAGPNYLGKSADTAEPAIRLSLRIMANMFGASANTRALMLRNRESFVGLLNDVVETVSGIEPETKRHQSEVAAATIALNYAKAIASESNVENKDEATFQLVSALCFTFSQNVRNPEALYRTLVALGTLGVVQPQVKSLAQDLDVKSFLARVPKGKLDKLDQAIAEARSVFL